MNPFLDTKAYTRGVILITLESNPSPLSLNLSMWFAFPINITVLWSLIPPSPSQCLGASSFR